MLHLVAESAVFCKIITFFMGCVNFHGKIHISRSFGFVESACARSKTQINFGFARLPADLYLSLR
jgi:hypothetical protein